MSVKIFIVSDFTGETAEHVAKAATSQFNGKDSEMVRFRYVNNQDRLMEIIRRAQGENALIIATLVDHQLRNLLAKEAKIHNIDFIDVLGPILGTLEKKIGSPPRETPGLMRRMDEEYFRRVKAIEFAIKCDDGKSPELLKDADIVLVGVSRSGKTPLAMYLAHKGLMVANMPLVPESPPPGELYEVEGEKIIGLTIDPAKLRRIRVERLRVLGLDPGVSMYARQERIEEELGYAKKIMEELKAKIFDVTNKAVEETAQEIMDYLNL